MKQNQWVIEDKHGHVHQIPLGRTLDLKPYMRRLDSSGFKLRDLQPGQLGACRTCHGTRFVQINGLNQLGVPGGMTVLTRCNACNGTGETKIAT